MEDTVSQFPLRLPTLSNPQTLLLLFRTHQDPLLSWYFDVPSPPRFQCFLLDFHILHPITLLGDVEAKNPNEPILA